MATTMTSTSIPLRPTPIDRVEYYQKSLSAYTNPGTARTARHWQFLISDSNNTIYYGIPGVTSIVAGVYIGTIAGLKTSDRNKVAGFAGGVGGGIFATVTYMTITEKTKKYKTWINAKMDYLIETSIYNKYSEDSILENFVCPVIQTMTPIPARTPKGHLFDLNEIMKCPRDENGHIKDPLRSEAPFSPSLLKLDQEAALLINKRMYTLICMDINAAGNSSAIVTVLGSQLEKTRNSIKLCYKGCLESIDYDLDQEIITFDEAQEKRTAFAECFGKTPEHELNWEFDWKDILDQRWRASNH